MLLNMRSAAETRQNSQIRGDYFLANFVGELFARSSAHHGTLNPLKRRTTKISTTAQIGFFRGGLKSNQGRTLPRLSFTLYVVCCELLGRFFGVGPGPPGR
jgi:hypothetical protein